MLPRGLERAVETVKALRAENGCPWDRAQTHSSLRTYLVEESQEVLEALDAVQSPGGKAHLQDELGDLLLQILLHAEIGAAEGSFNIDSIGNNLADKLIRRHPHVFGGAQAASAEDVERQWEKIKAKEKKKESCLDGIQAGLPSLQKSIKVISRVSKVGFQWPDLQGPLDKVREELGEFLEEVNALGVSVNRDTEISDEQKSRLESELGDLLFTLSNVAYFLHLNPEDALRTMLGRFERRFRYVEKRAKEMGQELENMNLSEMDRFWDEAKALEKKEKA
jgi:tetrapyrrole methylase family protein/MazG family protein